MAFTLFKNKAKPDTTKAPNTRNEIINANIRHARTLQEHCQKLILNLDQENKAQRIDSNMQTQIQDFSDLWVKLYEITKVIVNRYLEEKFKSEGADILTYMSQNIRFTSENPTILISELKKRKELLTKIIERLTQLLNK